MVEIGQLSRDTSSSIPPYRAIFTSLPVWAIILSQTGIDFSFYVMTTDLPKYMALMGFNIEQNGLYSALPQVMNFLVTLSFGFISDLVINRKYLSVKHTRKLFTTIGCFGLAGFQILASYAGCDRLRAVLFISFAVGFSGMENSRVNNIDLSPNYAPTIISIVNSCGSLMGILAPNVVGLLVSNVRESI
jgi:ACS family sodium-dependent inorganic phosphate cotransporter